MLYWGSGSCDHMQCMLEANAVWTVYFQECSENNVYSPLYVPNGAFADVPHNIYLLFSTMYCTIHKKIFDVGYYLCILEAYKHM